MGQGEFTALYQAVGQDRDDYLKQKERRLWAERIAEIPDEQERLIIATGR